MKLDFTQPDFLFCELPIKDGSMNDGRLWIYHRLSLSLIEFICVNDFTDFEFEGKQELFLYDDEEWFGVYVQNNCEATGSNADEVIRRAWDFLEKYFKWEDNQ